MNRDLVSKLIALFCFVSLAVALIVAHRSPATGYELSPYAGTPSAVWVLMAIALVGGIGVVLHEVVTGRHEESRMYLVGFAVALMTAVAFLALPFVRDYVTWRGDHIGHFGYLQDMAQTGHIGSQNPYPIVHVLFFQIATVTGASTLSVVNLNTALLVPIFMLNTYLLATVILPRREHQLLAALIAGGAMVGLGRYYLIPNVWSIAMLPVVFYCYFRRDMVPFKILLVLLLIAYPFFHPLSALVLIVALAAIEVLKPLYWQRFRGRFRPLPAWADARPTLWPVLLETAVFLPWVLTRDAFASNRATFWDQLTSGWGSGEISDIAMTLAKVDVQGADLAILTTKLYGGLLILAGLACIGVVLLIKRWWAGHQDNSNGRLLFIGILLILGALSYVVFLLGMPGAEAFAPDRILIYVEIASIPVAAFVLWEWGKRQSSTALVWGVLFVVLIALSVLNFLGQYQSPYIMRPNEQITKTDIAGMSWYLDSKDPVLPSIFIVSPPKRFSEGILGTTATRSRPDIPYDAHFEDHFGYTQYKTLGEQFKGEVYATVHEYDKVVYQTVWATLDRFNDEDFARLEQDLTVERIYSNGVMDCLHISQGRGIGQAAS